MIPRDDFVIPSFRGQESLHGREARPAFCMTAAERDVVVVIALLYLGLRIFFRRSADDRRRLPRAEEESERHSCDGFYSRGSEASPMFVEAVNSDSLGTRGSCDRI